MKQFVFDRLVDRENICNLDDEQQALRQAVQQSARVVVYGPRNFGKTSVVHNVTIEEFRSAHRRSFVFAADLLGVRSMRSLTQRMAASLQRCFAASFPVKGLLENAGRFLGSLRPEIALDPHTGSPSLSLHPGDAEPVRTLQDGMQRVPEAINRLCAQLLELHENSEIDHAMVGSALVTLLENREGRYASYLSTFSGTDETVLTEVARHGTVEHPQSKSFLRSVNLSSRTVRLSVKRLWDHGVVEHVEGSYRIADPLLAAYLRRYR